MFSKVMRNSIVLLVVLCFWGGIVFGESTVRKVTKVADLPAKKQQKIQKENKQKADRKAVKKRAHDKLKALGLTQEEIESLGLKYRGMCRDTDDGEK